MIIDAPIDFHPDCESHANYERGIPEEIGLHPVSAVSDDDLLVFRDIMKVEVID